MRISILVLLALITSCAPSIGFANDPPLEPPPPALADTPLHIFQPPSSLPAFQSEDRKLWVTAALQFNQLANKVAGGSLQVGFQPGALFGFDIRVHYALTTFDKLGVQPDPTVKDNLAKNPDPIEVTEEVPTLDGGTVTTTRIITFPQSTIEWERVRGNSDPWRVIMLEPGLNISGHLFPSLLPLLLQKARVGLAYVQMSDQLNNLVFIGYLFSFEAALQYQLGHGSRFGIEASVNHHYGPLQLQGTSGAIGTLPFSFLTSSIALVIWL